MEVYNPELFGAVCSSCPSEAQKKQFAHKEEGKQVKEVMRNLEKEHHAKIARRIAKEEHKAAERQKAEAEEQENYKREVEIAVWNEFKKRNDAFFIRHADMFEATLPIIERTMWNDACARREVYNKWHEEVYKPIQYQIDKAVERKCNSTNRPHIYQTIKDKWNVPHYCCNNNSTIGRGEYEWNEKFADEIHVLQDREFYFTNTADNENNNNKCNLEGYNTLSVKLHLESADYAHTNNAMMHSNAAPMITKSTYTNSSKVKSIKPHKLTWKEQKDELWQSFLRESNRKSCYGGRHGIILDVIDEISYDPLRQCREDTIYYHVPNQHGSNSYSALFSMNKNKEKLKRRAIADMYNKLALAYRTEEDKSITGVLKHTYHVPTSATSTPPASAYTNNNNYRIQSTNNNKYQDTQSKNQRSRLHPPVYVENEYVHLPHVFIPFDYGAYREGDKSNSNDSTDRNNNKKKENEYSEQECIIEADNASSGKVDHTNGMSNEPIEKESRRSNDKYKKQIAKPLMPFNTFSNQHLYHSVDTMSSNNLSFLPHVTLPTTMYARKSYNNNGNNNNKDLTVCQWGERELANTRYGRYVSTRGDVLPLCARRQKYALQASKSNVHFDHFNYPRGNDNE